MVDVFGAVDDRFGADPFCAGGAFSNDSSYNSGDPFNAGNPYNGNDSYSERGPFNVGDPYNGSDSYNNENSFDDSFAAPTGGGYTDPGGQAFDGGFYGGETSWG